MFKNAADGVGSGPLCCGTTITETAPGVSLSASPAGPAGTCAAKPVAVTACTGEVWSTGLRNGTTCARATCTPGVCIAIQAKSSVLTAREPVDRVLPARVVAWSWVSASLPPVAST